MVRLGVHDIFVRSRTKVYTVEFIPRHPSIYVAKLEDIDISHRTYQNGRNILITIERTTLGKILVAPPCPLHVHIEGNADVSPIALQYMQGDTYDYIT